MNVPILSKAEIRRCLASYLGRAHVLGWGLKVLGTYTGISHESLRRYANGDTERMAPARQRLLSKVLSQIENGQIAFRKRGLGRGRGTRSEAYVPEAPRPIARYGVKLGPGGPQLVTQDRPKPYQPVPSFKDVLLR